MQNLEVLIAQHPFQLALALIALAFGLWVALWVLVQKLRQPLWTYTVRLWSRLLAHPKTRALSARIPALTRLRKPAALSGSFLFLDLLAGFLLVLAALSVFFELADETGLDEDLGRFDDRLAAALRESASASVLRFFSAVTHLADVEVQTGLCIAIAILLVLRGQRLLATIWVAAVAGNGLLNRLLKAIFERARPLHEHGWTAEQGWSFPSGHASGAVTVYGMLAYLAIRALPAMWHLPLALSAIAAVLLVGCSRVILQVHYFSDVLAGYASGSAWVIVCIGAAEMLRAHRRRASVMPPCASVRPAQE